MRLIYIVLGGPEYIVSSLTNDDTYYYFNTAWNTKINGFATFDSIHKTNGLHPLWFFIVYALSFLADSKILFLNILLFSNLIIIGFSFIPVYTLGKTIKDKYFALILSTIWFMQLLLYDVFFMGMENTIHSIIIWYIFLYLVKVLEGNDNIKKSFLILTFLLVINVWTRYDSIIFSSIIYIIITIYSFLYKKKKYQLKLF